MAVTINGTTGITANSSVFTDASGNVGIGTTSPNQKLTISSASSTEAAITLTANGQSATSELFVGQGTDNTAYIQNRAAKALVFGTSDTERMRIDSSGIVTGTAGNLMLVSSTAVSASGTSVAFTGIPSWVKRITVLVSGISTNGSSNLIFQVGNSGGFITSSGYSGFNKDFATGSFSTAANGSTYVLIQRAVGAATTFSGRITLVNINGNQWLIESLIQNSSDNTDLSICSMNTSSTLDRVRITTVNGTDTFDAGTINILYE